MGIIDQIWSQCTPDEAPTASRATLSKPRRYIFEKRESLDDVLGTTPPSISSTLSDQFRAPTPAEQLSAIEASSPRSAHEMIDDIRSAAICSGRAAHERARPRVHFAVDTAYLHERVDGISPVASPVHSAHDLTPSALPGQNWKDQGFGTVDRVRTKAIVHGSIVRKRRESSEDMQLAAAAAERLAAASSHDDLMLRAECEAVKRSCKKPAKLRLRYH